MRWLIRFLCIFFNFMPPQRPIEYIITLRARNYKPQTTRVLRGYPRHPCARKYASLFLRVRSSEDLESVIASLPLAERGVAFEVFAEAVLALDDALMVEVYPYTEVVRRRGKIALGSFNRKLGYDFALKKIRSNRYSIGEAKFRNKGKQVLPPASESFYLEAERLLRSRPRIEFVVVVSTTNSFPLPARMDDRYIVLRRASFKAMNACDYMTISMWLMQTYTECPHWKYLLNLAHTWLSSNLRRMTRSWNQLVRDPSYRRKLLRAASSGRRA